MVHLNIEQAEEAASGWTCTDESTTQRRYSPTPPRPSPVPGPAPVRPSTGSATAGEQIRGLGTTTTTTMTTFNSAPTTSELGEWVYVFTLLVRSAKPPFLNFPLSWFVESSHELMRFPTVCVPCGVLSQQFESRLMEGGSALRRGGVVSGWVCSAARRRVGGGLPAAAAAAAGGEIRGRRAQVWCARSGDGGWEMGANKQNSRRGRR